MSIPSRGLSEGPAVLGFVLRHDSAVGSFRADTCVVGIATSLRTAGGGAGDAGTFRSIDGRVSEVFDSTI